MEEVGPVKDQYTQELMRKPNVVGVGVGYKIVGGKQTKIPSIIVFVRRKVSLEHLSPEEAIPAQIEGVATDVVESGEIFAHQSRTDKYRPAPGGVSIGHYQITAGTLGVAVRDKASGKRLILSNNHVLANSNSATIGDPILQPGSADGGTVEEDRIGSLLRFEPIRFQQTPGPPGTCNTAAYYAALGNMLAGLAGSDHRLATYRIQQEETNLVDAAVAQPLNEGDVLDEILEIGPVTGVVEASAGMNVRKSGRTTGLTTGQIIALNTTVTVSYGAGRNAVFEGQIVSGPMSQPGDSGSLLVDGASDRAVGLLFAGSNTTTIYNRIQVVQDLLNVTVGG